MPNSKRKAIAIIRMPLNNQPGHSLKYAEIEDSLKGLNGVANAQINHVANTVRVEYDPEKLTLESIRKRLDLSQI